LGSPRKAIIFTESRKTQNYLLQVLADSSYNQGVVLFNGSKTDESSREIYKLWHEKNLGTDKITGSRTADMRTALVEYFRDEGSIL
jgi:adenine-specific DNA-methyltransferase